MIMSVSTLIIFSGAATPSSTVNFSIFHPRRRKPAVRNAKWRGAARGSTRCLRGGRLCGFLGLELRFAIESANLNVVLGVILLPRQLLRREMFPVRPPGAQALGVFKLHYRHPL